MASLTTIVITELLWPPFESCDPSRPRADLIAFMGDPKKPVDQDYQGIDITGDRIFLDGARYGDLERETQEKVRRELQECFTEQGCARPLSVKEWAKQSNERQTPRLRLRCTKVCGFGFQVNFDIDRNQYYLVRSKGKSGNFTHKCPAPAALVGSPPPALPMPTMVSDPALVQMLQTPALETFFLMPVPSMPLQMNMEEAAILPQPQVGGVHYPTANGNIFPMPATVFHQQQQQQQQQPLAPTMPTGGAVFGNSFHSNEIPVILQHQQQQQQQPPPALDHPANIAFPSASLPETTLPAAGAMPMDLNDMDMGSINSTDMMFARHFFGSDASGEKGSAAAVGGKRRPSASALSVFSDNGVSDTLRSNSRMQSYNEAEFPTVNSLKSYISMMTDSINANMSKAFLSRNGSSHSQQQQQQQAAADDNMMTLGSHSYYASALQRIQSGASLRDAKGLLTSQDDMAMDTVNSHLSGLSLSGSRTMGTQEEDAASSPGANPFSPDFWNPPPS
jgi:hypothetical protein